MLGLTAALVFSYPTNRVLLDFRPKTDSWMRLKLLLRYPVDVSRAQRLLRDRPSSPLSTTDRPLVLDLRTPQLLFDCGRHLRSIAYYAKQAGSPTVIRCGNLLLGGIARKVFGRELLVQPDVQRITPRDPIPANSMVLGDYLVGQTELQSLAERSICFYRMCIGRDIDRSVVVMPYPMHPATLRYLPEMNLTALRNYGPDRRCVFFAGSQKTRYGDRWMQREFGVLSRLEILDSLRQRFANRVQSQLPSSTGETKIVIQDSRVNAIPASQWLTTLARAGFFICCPGGRQPLCHNLIEAMSVGTIPIIEYGDRITPSLRDGDTAICYRGRAGLFQAMKRVDQMGHADRIAMSRRVTSFYDQHLCGTKFFADLRRGTKQAETGSEICMPFHERNFYSPGRPLAA